jgi:hypothetical protein
MSLTRAQKIYAVCLSIACFALFNGAAKRLSPGEARIVKKLPASGARAAKPLPSPTRRLPRVVTAPAGVPIVSSGPGSTNGPATDIIPPPLRLCHTGNGWFNGNGYQPGGNAWLDTAANCDQSGETWCYVTFIDSLWIWNEQQQKYVVLGSYPVQSIEVAPYCGTASVPHHFQMSAGTHLPLDKWFVLRTEIWDTGASPHKLIFYYDFEFQNFIPG